jgi:beta-galactosidase
MFRFEKPAALFYKSQCDPKDEIVLEPIFLWSMGDWSGDMGLPYAMVCSNCDKLKFYIGKTLVSTEYPCREDFKNLPYPPFVCRKLIKKWGVRYEDLTIEGYIKGKKVISKRMSSAGLDAKFHLTPDSRKLYADGTDMTFLRFFVTDEFNNIRPYAQGAVQLEITGPGEIIGENPFALVGGKGAVLVRSKQSSGKINITASHDQLGIKQTRIVTVKRPKEAV